MTVEADKRTKWQQTERRNTREALSKVKMMLFELGFTSTTPHSYRISLNGKACGLGLSKLSRTPRLRIFASVDGIAEPLIGHADVSRFQDNSEDCANKVVQFVKSVALPWFQEQTGGRHA